MVGETPGFRYPCSRVVTTTTLPYPSSNGRWYGMDSDTPPSRQGTPSTCTMGESMGMLALARMAA